MIEAEQGRDEGIAQAENAADPRVIVAIDDVIERAIASGRRFSANDIRDQFPTVSNGLIGARMRSYATRRVDGLPLMKKVGTVPSTLKSTHAHDIKVWIGFDAWQALNRTTS
ncbi:hypothetical protein GCM10028801_06840 [Nocardioides maradonensis]